MSRAIFARAEERFESSAPLVGSRASESGPRRLSIVVQPAEEQAVESHDFDVPARLERKFGLGGDPARRRVFYARLGRRVEQHGERAYRVIAECVAESVGKDYPQKWFSRVVILRLREAGLLVDQVDDW